MDTQTETPNEGASRTLEMYHDATSALLNYLQEYPVSTHAIEAAQPFFVGLLRAWRAERWFSEEQRQMFVGFDKAMSEIPALSAGDQAYAKRLLEMQFRNLNKYKGEPNSLPLLFLKLVAEVEKGVVEDERERMCFQKHTAALHGYFTNPCAPTGNVEEALRAFAGYFQLLSDEAYRQKYPFVVSTIEDAIRDTAQPPKMGRDELCTHSLLREHVVSLTRFSLRKRLQLSEWKLLTAFFSALNCLMQNKQ